MRTTIDSSGRLVVPKALRDALGLRGGEDLEIQARDGRIEVTPVSNPMHLERCGEGLVAVSDAEVSVLTADRVRETLEQTRA